MNRRGIMFGVFCGLFVIALVGIVLGCHNLSNRKTQAIHIAQDYLEQKYLKEMQYLKAYLPGIDTGIYRVFFTPINNTNLVVEVKVMSNLTLRNSNIVNNRHYMPDNYYMADFGQKMAGYFTSGVKEIWGITANTFVTTPNPSSAAFAVPVGLNDQMPLTEMEGLIEEYLIHVNTEILLNEHNIMDEAKKISAFIEYIRDSGYEPDTLVIRYIAPKTLKNNSGLTIIGISDWQTATTAELIVKQLKVSLTK